MFHLTLRCPFCLEQQFLYGSSTAVIWQVHTGINPDGEMSKPCRTCDDCYKMISMPHLLEHACSPEGLSIIIQSVEAFLHGLELGCYLCQVIHDFSKNYEHSKVSNSFYHINEHESLFKNIKCRKLDRQGNHTEIPVDLHFGTMEIMSGSSKALEEITLDVQALDSELPSGVRLLFPGLATHPPLVSCL